jgi:uncharacterized protein (DUF697 family)/uncharacterized protein YneF (UPF0154 family)
MLRTLLLVLLVLVAVAFVLFAVLAVWVFFYLRRQVRQNLRPNPQQIHTDLERLRRANPTLGPDELAAKLINSQSLFLGLTGALSGLGGLAFALVGMPIDLSVSTLRQMKMVHMLTAIYGNDDLDPEELEVRYMSLVLGGAGAAKLLLRLVIKIIGESIPLVGSFAGFGINWMITKSIGEAAVSWNKGQTLRERGTQIYREQRVRLAEAGVKVASGAASARQALRPAAAQPVPPVAPQPAPLEVGPAAPVQGSGARLEEA